MTVAGDAVLAVARGEVGYVEGPDNSTKYWGRSLKYGTDLVDTRGMTGDARIVTHSRSGKPVTHGTTTGYTWHGCRCADCTGAMRDKARERRGVLHGPPKPPPAHGTHAAYQRGCRCADCTEANRAVHREYVRHNRDRTNELWVGWYRRRAETYRAERLSAIAQLGGQCVDCGITDERVLHFDHVDPLDKADAVTKLLRNKGLMAEAVQAELAKCLLRCANCHTIKTLTEGDQYTGRRRRVA